MEFKGVYMNQEYRDYRNYPDHPAYDYELTIEKSLGLEKLIKRNKSNFTNRFKRCLSHPLHTDTLHTEIN